MWLWTERDLALYAVVGLFLLEVYVGTQYFAWSPVCLLYPILSSSSGSRKAQELQDELMMIFAPEYRFWRRVNIPVSIQVLVCHNMTTYLLIVLAFSPGQRDLYVGKVPCWQTYVWAFLLLVLSIIGMIGTNLVWACGSVRLSLKRKVFLMICQSIANQGSIFRWSRDQRCHLKNKGRLIRAKIQLDVGGSRNVKVVSKEKLAKTAVLLVAGTDADPYDPNRGALYRYIGWFLMHKTPKMIEATRSVDVSDLLQDQVVMFQADVDSWWNLSLGHAIPAFVTLLWGEELFLGWVIAGCFRSVLALHINLTLLRFQHLWAPQTVTFTGADSSEEEEASMGPWALGPLGPWGMEHKVSPKQLDLQETTTSGRTSQQAEQTRRMGAAHQPAILRSVAGRMASIADAQKLMEESSKGLVPPLELSKSASSEADDGGGVFVKYKVNESGGGDPSLEVRLEPLWRRSTLVDLAKDAVADILQVPAASVKPDRPLMDLGFDSAGALRLRNKLARRLKIELPPTLLFDHPTINDMVDNGLALLSKRPMTPVGELPVTGAQHASAAQHVMVSTSCHLPGAANSLKDYWNLLAEKRDAVVQVPLARWDHELYYSKEPQKGKTYARHGGFVEGTDLFDVTYFNLGTAEAKTTDPQQRLLLTAAYDALRGDGYDKALLQNNPLGVFTALSNLDWYQLVVPEAGVYTGPGVSSAIAANRISYVFGLKGPSMTVARKNVSAPVHRGALLNAAEVLHGPSSFVLRSVAGMLSPDGRCKTFDATADGYIRGEGAGAILLKPAESAEEGRCLRIAEVRAVAPRLQISGSGFHEDGRVMNQDGKSATLTAPNGPSQEELLVMALREAHVAASALNALECPRLRP
ncbi:unnamed protein product [Cladocopium goreaui]|uniref:Erythronolide synthase, modules 5 and 6 n=1 Tax=Cladocopium goreaui TaxID=2562237 RepID=A0A9P1CQ13_9DINO|nr:unnamed protein product [Cladocopium goreaui]